MYKRMFAVFVATVVIVFAASTVMAQATPKIDPNRTAQVTNNVDPATIVALIKAAASSGQTCGIGFIPGPSNSAAIRLTLFNVVSDQITNVTIDPFLAFGRRSFVIQSTFGLVAPPGGTLTDLYPDGPANGRGPVVLAATNWGAGESAILSMDPDTYANPSFGATVGQMSGTVIETAYVASGRRCRGSLAFNSSLNASVALLTQVSPVP